MRAAHVVCEDPALAFECQRADPEVPVSVLESSRVPATGSPAWLELAKTHLPSGGVLGICLIDVPELQSVIELSDAAHASNTYVALSVLRWRHRQAPLLDAATDMGIVVVREVEPLLIVLRLLAHDLERPWLASHKHLSATDRIRLERSYEAPPGGKRVGQVRSTEDGTVVLIPKKNHPSLPLGSGPAVAEAFEGMHRTAYRPQRVTNTVDDVDAQAVMDVLFGPRRALSDPASKAALAPYGLPLPIEELCTSPSRAAAEATRIGFPVRIALASPDLRIWDHPELAADMLDSAAQVRERFRQLQALVERTQTGENAANGDRPRVLGLSVMATGRAIAMFRVLAEPLPSGRVRTVLAFADPHGAAAADQTLIVLPGAAALVERAVERLAGGRIILAASPKERQALLEALTDVLLRTAAFVNDRRREVERVELRPVALLPDGTAEIREACIQVSDAFERSMDATLAE